VKVSARQGDTLDAICWRELGRTEAVVEQALALNPGLADIGPLLPAGTEVTLPEPAALAPAVRETVKLWD
jgi:phage tail protein X